MVFIHSSIYPAKFSDIFRFCGHPELLHLRKINWDNSLSLVRALWRPHADPPSLNILSTAAFDAVTLNALSAECIPHICHQVLRPQVQVQVLQICTRMQLEYKYKYQVLHVCR